MKKILISLILAAFLLCSGCGSPEEKIEKQSPVVHAQEASYEEEASAEGETKSVEKEDPFDGTPLTSVPSETAPGYIPDPEPVEPSSAEN